MPGALPASQIPTTGPARASEGPPPGVFDTLGASFRTASDDIGEVQRARLREAYSPLVKALRERNGKGAMAYNSWQSFVPVVSSFADLFDGDAVWRDIEAARAADPKAFADLPKTRAEFEQQALTRGGDRLRDQRVLARSTHGIAAFAGAVPAQFRDPLNVATAPIGGGAKTLAQAFLREAVINGAIEAVQQVPLAQARQRMGEELTGGEAVGNVLTGAAFGGLLGLGGKAVADHWAGITAAPKAVQEKAWAAIVDRVPGLRERLGAAVNWNALDDHLPDIAEAVVPPERLTDAERGAVAALRRDAAMTAANPFVPDGAGNAAYYRALGETMQGIMDGAPAYVPRMRPSPAARLRGGTSIASGVTGDAMATVKSRIGIVESGGRANASNPRSSAAGLYQFTDGTWLAYYKRRYGAGGLSDAAIIAKKRDVDIQNALMDDLMGDNARALQQAGHAADAGNLYLAHFAGRKGATDLLEADPGATARAVLGDHVVDANPFLKDMTAGDVIAWAHRKMGGEAPAPGRVSRGTGEDAFARLDEELAQTRAEIAALDAEIDGQAVGVRGTVDALAEDIEPTTIADAEPLAPAPAEAPDPARAEIAAMTPEARALMPELRRIVDEERSVSLNRSEQLAGRLATDERNLQLALQQMAIDGLVARNAKGKFLRLPRRKDGPEDIWTFIAARGGLADNEGHDLSTIFEVEREVRWQRKPDRNGLGGIPLDKPYRTKRPAFVPGQGPLVRKSAGMPIDRMGEALWEAGFFGPMEGTPRPTTSDVITMLQDAWGAGRKLYSTFDEAQVAAMEAPAANVATRDNPFLSEFQSEEHYDFEFRNFDAVAESEFGLRLDEEAFEDAYRIWREGGEGDMPTAIATMIQRELEDVQAREIAEKGLPDAADVIEEWEAALRADGILGDEEGAGRWAEPGNARADGPTRQYAVGEGSGPLDAAAWREWDDPDGPAAEFTTDSLAHDVRASLDNGDAVDPAIAARQADEARLRAEAPLRGANKTGQEQDGTIGLGLFDAADQPQFRLEEEGAEISAADLLAEFDEDAAFLKTVRDCL